MLINSPISFGELADKLTILIIKCDNIKEESKLKNIRHEYEQLGALYDQSCNDLPFTVREAIHDLTKKLISINSKLWVIEDDIRECERKKQFDDTFIQLARSVYINNDERAKLKRQINNFTNSSIVEEKSYKEYQ